MRHSIHAHALLHAAARLISCCKTACKLTRCHPAHPQDAKKHTKGSTETAWGANGFCMLLPILPGNLARMDHLQYHAADHQISFMLRTLHSLSAGALLAWGQATSAAVRHGAVGPS